MLAGFETLKGAFEQRAAAGGQAHKHATGGVVGGHGGGFLFEGGAGIQAFLEQEGGGEDFLLAGHEGALHGGGAAPGGQLGEVQVHPAVAQGFQRGQRQQGAVGDHGGCVSVQFCDGCGGFVVPAVCLHNGQAELFGTLRHRGGGEHALATHGGVLAGEHADHAHLIGVREVVERGHGNVGGACVNDVEHVDLLSEAAEGRTGRTGRTCTERATCAEGTAHAGCAFGHGLSGDSVVVCGAQGTHDALAVLANKAVDEELAVQVVGFVLQHAREQAFALQHEGFAVAVHAGHARPVLARGRGLLAGHGQAAFAAFLVFFADFEHGVDDVAFAVVNAAEGEDLLGDANLRAGKAHAAHVVHGF